MLRKTLTELANLHGSDKGTIGPSTRWRASNYTAIYEGYFERYRDSPLTILEIGLGVIGDRWDAHIVHGRNTGGASLKMWYDYFPFARIYGIDVNPSSHLENERIVTFVADQGNRSDLEKFAAATRGTEFDVIVDDGSHRPDHQQISLGYLFQRVKPGGLYFIEDLAANGMADGASGRHACNAVRNTRRVLKEFYVHGSFAEPNALGDSAYLAQTIACINFHAPQQAVDTVADGQPMTRYQPDTERLCAIQKR